MPGPELAPLYLAGVAAAAVGLLRSIRDPLRRRTSLAALLWMSAVAWRSELAVVGRTVGVEVLNGAMLALVLSLCWRSRTIWPVLAAGLQLLACMTLLADLTDSRIASGLQVQVSTWAAHAAAVALCLGSCLPKAQWAPRAGRWGLAPAAP